MKSFLTVIVVFLWAGFLNAQIADFQKGDPAPIFEKNAPDGTVLKLSDIDSELILLDFWAGWCKGCVKTINKALKPLHKKYDRKQLQIVGVSYDKTESLWKDSIKKFDLPWLHVYDSHGFDLYKRYGIEVIPSYFLIDKNGTIVAAKIPATELEAAIDRFFTK